MEREEINIENYIKLQVEPNYRLQDNDKVYVHGKDLGPVDYLVLTIILLISVGISLSRSLLGKSDLDDDQGHMIKFRYKIQDEKEKKWTLRRILGFSLSTAGSMVSPFVNTLCLFSMNGEVFSSGISIVVIFLGILLSILFIFLTNFYSIMKKNRFKSVAFYLKKRFRAKTCSLLVVASSIVRQIIGGSLNLHIVSVVVSSMTELASTVVSILVVTSCIVCVSASRIHSRPSASFGGTFIWLLAASVLITLMTVTKNEGGMISLFSKAQAEDKFSWPSFSLLPWTSHSFWGNMSIGFFMGAQIYIFSRVNLRCVVELPKRVLFSTIAVSLLYILLWLSIGIWAGICTSVVFESSQYKNEYLSPKRIDGTLAKMVSLEMEGYRGFRGFFLAALLAASISGLSRRYNQLIGFVHFAIKDIKSSYMKSDKPKEDKNSAKYILSHPPPTAPESYLDQLRWEEKQRTCFPIFSFKFFFGLLFGILTIWIVWILNTSSERIWELWITVIGILNGPVIAVLLLALFCPFVPHVSVIIGLLLGWFASTSLAIGNRVMVNPVLFNNYSLDYNETVESIKSPTFYESLWERNFPDKRDKQFEDIMSRRTQIPIDFDIVSPLYKLFSTSFCYYGFVGLMICLLSAIVFSGIMRLHNSSINAPRNLVHPSCARFLQTTEEYVRSHYSGQSLYGRRKKRKMAMSLAQETGGV